MKIINQVECLVAWLFNECSLPFSELKKLSEESLTRQPEEVFDIICKLGEGSYGSVYKALHKESGQVLAIKQVPVDTDLQEIIKEISIMQQCDSPYVVKYYGSYFKNTDLWVSYRLLVNWTGQLMKLPIKLLSIRPKNKQIISTYLPVFLSAYLKRDG